MSASDDGDESLLNGLRQGSPDAIARLYERHAGQLLRMLRALTGSEQDSEDIVHDLFLGLPELLRTYEHRGQLNRWLRTVAVRIALMKMRTAHRRDRYFSEREAGDDIAAPSTDVWTATDLNRALERLPDSLRVVFVLRQIEDRSHDEIAELLGLSAGAVRVRYVRAIRHLRLLLEPGA